MTSLSFKPTVRKDANMVELLDICRPHLQTDREKRTFGMLEGLVDERSRDQSLVQSVIQNLFDKGNPDLRDAMASVDIMFDYPGLPKPKEEKKEEETSVPATSTTGPGFLQSVGRFMKDVFNIK